MLAITDDAKKAAQSETVQLLADRIAFRHTRLYGAQDTVFAAPAGARQYFLQSFVNGSCDAIFGMSSIVFEQCEIANTDHITAMAGGSFVWNEARGSRAVYLFVNSSLVKPAPGTMAYPAKDHASELGRPWRSMSAVVYKDVWMDSHIAKYGWGDWSHGCSSGLELGANCLHNSSCWCQNVTYVEFGSTGPGASPSTRVKWSHQLTSDADPIRGALGLAGTTPHSVMGDWESPFAEGPADSLWPSPMLPRWKPTYNMSLSMIMQPCNYSGFLEPTYASKFGLVDTVRHDSI